jgi:hypothetical protein
MYVNVTFNAMNTFCVSTYGRDLLTVDGTCAMWVAEKFGGRANWRKIYSRRDRIGKYMPHPAFNSVCWA